MRHLLEGGVYSFYPSRMLRLLEGGVYKRAAFKRRNTLSNLNTYITKFLLFSLISFYMLISKMHFPSFYTAGLLKHLLVKF